MFPRIDIRSPEVDDEHEFVASASNSRKLHSPWTSAPSSSTDYFSYIERMRNAGNAAFFVCRKDSGQIAGVINVTNMIHGNFRSAYLGYYAFAGHEHQGFMREGLKAVVRHSFHVLKLHRLEANIQPENLPSIALVTACGFVKEGYSPRYLKIGGRWRDHERWAVVAV